jgi:hypothetical protein
MPPVVPLRPVRGSREGADYGTIRFSQAHDRPTAYIVEHVPSCHPVARCDPPVRTRPGHAIATGCAVARARSELSHLLLASHCFASSRQPSSGAPRFVTREPLRAVLHVDRRAHRAQGSRLVPGTGLFQSRFASLGHDNNFPQFLKSFIVGPRAAATRVIAVTFAMSAARCLEPRKRPWSCCEPRRGERPGGSTGTAIQTAQFFRLDDPIAQGPR